MSRIFKGKKCHAFGFDFDSEIERDRYFELRQSSLYGDIIDLKVHPEFTIKAPNGNEICKYTADFSYNIAKTGEYVVEDVKSYNKKTYYDINGKKKTKYFGTKTTEAWSLRRRMMKELMGINVREILMDNNLRSIIKDS
jgi:hypothetical protein